ncbi:MAG TPA: GNAT family N-acetyltransferase [Mucilaginibacter sp.]|jgi:GNAT superfamily N-acetyltransferase
MCKIQIVAGISDKEILQRVYHLRVQARNDLGIITFEKYPDGWFDHLDETAKHFIVLRDGILIGSARLNLFDCIQHHPYYPAIEHLVFAIKDRIAYFSRAAVHPDFRSNGLWTDLINERLLYAKDKNVKHAFLDASPEKENMLVLKGWKSLGRGKFEKISWELEPEHYLFYNEL